MRLLLHTAIFVALAPGALTFRLEVLAGDANTTAYGTKTAVEWFAVFQAGRFHGLYELGILNVAYMACMLPVYVGLAAAHSRVGADHHFGPGVLDYLYLFLPEKVGEVAKPALNFFIHLGFRIGVDDGDFEFPQVFFLPASGDEDATRRRRYHPVRP